MWYLTSLRSGYLPQLQPPAPTLLRAALHKTDTVAAMRQAYPEGPPIYSLPTAIPT